MPEAGRQQSWALMINIFNHDWAQQISSKLISPDLPALSFFLSLRQMAHPDHDQKPPRRGGSRRRGSTTLAVGRLSTRSIIEICDSFVRILPSKGKLKSAAALRSGLPRQPCACVRSRMRVFNRSRQNGGSQKLTVQIFRVLQRDAALLPAVLFATGCEMEKMRF